jgi:SAM-dependent methyltransferase
MSLVHAVVRAIRARWFPKPFPGSERYWIERYATGRNSGPGSYGELAEFKAEVLTDFVRTHAVKSVIEFGCGDGNQLRLASYPRYTGLDVSPQAVALCRERFRSDPTKTFKHVDDYAGERAELALSLDVVFHLVEDEVFAAYMARLFAAADRFVIVYSSNTDEQPPRTAPHVRHRKFTRWVETTAPDWELLRHVPNRYPHDPDTDRGSFADFFIFARTQT